jgi:hypothetical protein
LKLNHDKLLSTFAFNCNLRPYSLEMFDEMEEWNLIQAHYCIAWWGSAG